MRLSTPVKKALILAVKVGAGCALSVLIAQMLQLSNITAAGTVCLLTLVTTKKETYLLFFYRLLTFFITVILALAIYPLFHSVYLSFGLVTFFLVLVTELLHVSNTLSVCALINMHFFSTSVHDAHFILNELVLVLIGLLVAMLFNQFFDFDMLEKDLEGKVKEVDEKFEGILRQIKTYILEPSQSDQVWLQIGELEHLIPLYMKDAMEYRDNVYLEHAEYYIRYFEMRQRQLILLHSLHNDLRRIRTMPWQALELSDFVDFTIERFGRHERPLQQLERLERLIEKTQLEMHQAAQEDFSSQAIFYHCLLDLYTFIEVRDQFILKLDPEQRKLYWNTKENEEQDEIQ